MASAVYLLCSATALACASLLLRAYARTGTRLLLWSGMCFVFLTASNLLVIVDLLIFPALDLFIIRNFTALFGLTLLLYGLIWESR